jgi:uncharacterized membrane-anchored protein
MSSFSLADLHELADQIEEKFNKALERAHRYEVQLGIVQTRIERLEEQANDIANYD